jgi:hypothetical protein
MPKMTTFSHPVELSDEELDLVAAAGGGSSSECGCSNGDQQFGLVNVDTGDINVLNNTSVLSGKVFQSV